MGILIARGEYAEVQLGDTTEDMDYYREPQNLAWIDHLLGGPATSSPARSA